MAFVMTCRIAVRWKKGPQPIVVSGMRVVTVTSPLADRFAICYITSLTSNLKRLAIILTRDTPGDGFESVLIISVSFSI